MALPIAPPPNPKPTDPAKRPTLPTGLKKPVPAPTKPADHSDLELAPPTAPAKAPIILATHAPLTCSLYLIFKYFLTMRLY